MSKKAAHTGPPPTAVETRHAKIPNMMHLLSLEKTPEKTQEPLPNKYSAFAEALHEAMNRKRMNASALARAVWGTTKDYRGYDVAKNRDRIAYYLSGKSAPRDDVLKKLADILDVPLDHLAGLRPGRGGGETATVSVVPVERETGGPLHLVLKCSVLLPMAIAMKILKLINDAPNDEKNAAPLEVAPAKIQLVLQAGSALGLFECSVRLRVPVAIEIIKLINDNKVLDPSLSATNENDELVEQ